MKMIFAHRRRVDNRDAHDLGKQVQGNHNMVGDMYFVMTLEKYFLVSNG